MDEECPECSLWSERGVKYCRNCGRKLEPKKSGSVIHTLVQTTGIIIVITVLLNTVYSLIHFGDICADCENLKFKFSLSFGLYDLNLFKVSGKYTAVLLALLLLTEVSCICFAIYRYILAWRKERTTGNEDCTDKTGLCAASSGLAASLLIGVVYFLIMALFSELPDTSWMDEYTEYQLSMMLTRAGVREELMFRVFLIGVPMVAIGALLVKDSKCWHYLLGGYGMSKSAWILIVFSSAIFGLAHYDGWGWPKIIEAGIGGVIFAYIYVEYGLYASIIAHTANDTLSSIGYLGFTGLESLFMLSLLGLGLITLVYWVIKPNYACLNISKMDWLPAKREGSPWSLWKRH